MTEFCEGLFWFSLFLIVYTYLIYPLILLLMRKKSSVTDLDDISLPSVSMVVSAYNEEAVIREKIANCLRLDYPKEKLEIIIASDGSSDSTAAIIEEYQKTGIKLFRYDYRSGKVNVLNRVIPLAQGEIIVLSDANTMYREEAIKKLVRNFSDPAVGCVCGKLTLKKPNDASGGELEGVYWKYENFLKELEGSRGALLGANGGIYAFRKGLFEPVHPSTIVEDFVIPMRILMRKYKVIYESAAVAFEETSKSLSDEHVRKIRIGAGAYQALFMMMPMLVIFRGFPSFAFWSHKVLRWLVPFLIIMLLLSNVFLLDNKFYEYFYMAQVLFYVMVFIGMISENRNEKIKLFSLSYYLISMNLCLLLGFFRFITRTQKVTWQKVGR